MKYVLIIALVIIIVRIDYVLRLFDRAAKKIETQDSAESVAMEASPASAVPLSNDPIIKSSPRSLFFSSLKDFVDGPSSETYARAIGKLKENPGLFNDQKDAELESMFYLFEEGLRNKNPLIASFLVEMASLLKGENSVAARNTLSIFMDADLAEFLKVYKNSKDETCSIATYQPESLNAQDKIYELAERLEKVDALLADEKLDPAVKPMLLNCQLRIKMRIDELTKELPATPEDNQAEPIDNSLSNPVPNPPANLSPEGHSP